jgi:hypothetical protein
VGPPITGDRLLPARTRGLDGRTPFARAIRLFGGIGSSSILNDTWTFNGTSWTEVRVSNPPPARHGAAMATLDNEVVLFGGGRVNDTWTFDGTTWVQVSVSNSPAYRRHPAMATLGNEVVLFGGSYLAGPYSPRGLSDTWRFDGTSWTQVSVTNSPPARYSYSPSMATLGNEIVLFGDW